MHKEHRLASEWTQIQMEHACHGALAFGKDRRSQKVVLHCNKSKRSGGNQLLMIKDAAVSFRLGPLFHNTGKVHV